MLVRKMIFGGSIICGAVLLAAGLLSCSSPYAYLEGGALSKQVTVDQATLVEMFAILAIVCGVFAFVSHGLSGKRVSHGWRRVAAILILVLGAAQVFLLEQHSACMSATGYLPVKSSDSLAGPDK